MRQSAHDSQYSQYTATGVSCADGGKNRAIAMAQARLLRACCKTCWRPRSQSLGCGILDRPGLQARRESILMSTDENKALVRRFYAEIEKEPRGDGRTRR